MRLTTDDVALFFKLMPTLQVNANRHLYIIKDMETLEHY
jgi:hypothetical protein